jgi:hypothetical protein
MFGPRDPAQRSRRRTFRQSGRRASNPQPRESHKTFILRRFLSLKMAVFCRLRLPMTFLLFVKLMTLQFNFTNSNKTNEFQFNHLLNLNLDKLRTVGIL